MTEPKLLFTPGPLTTSATVKAAMVRDLGSRDSELTSIVRFIRDELLIIGGAGASGEYECILMQGSGTFAVESAISSVMPYDGCLLVLINGAYGRRIAEMATVHGIEVEQYEVSESQSISANDVERLLNELPAVTHVAVVHCETTTGIVNPIEEIGEVVNRFGLVYIVDAVSSFGGLPIDLSNNRIDFLISCANKCIEGVPGFGFVLARRATLAAAQGHARTLSLDLYAQWAAFQQDGQFRFTPPTHTLLAFNQALRELQIEGGVPARNARYRENHEALKVGMQALGFTPYLAEEDQSCIITTYRYPNRPNFNFERFYTRLRELGFMIYSGKVSEAPCFRIGTIGHLDVKDIQALLKAIQSVMEEL